MLFCHPCTNREQQSSCVGVRRTGSRAVLLLAHQEKCCVVSIIHSSSLELCSVSWYIASSPLGKPCREQVLCPRTLSSANPCLSCALRGVQNPLFGPVLRALGEVRDVSSGFSAHFVRCERVLSFPACSGSSAISCPTHLVTCLHRVSVVCEKTSLSSVTCW